MKLIGAGLPRTGTLSQKVALEMLGLRPCYHMVNVLSDLELVPAWRRALEGEADWEELLGGFPATVDWPAAYFYRELLAAYPDAKVLLSVRDAEAWERSMRGTIWRVLYGEGVMRDLSSARARIDPHWEAYTALMRELWERSGLISAETGAAVGMGEAMERYNAEVQAVVPADRLLV